MANYYVESNSGYKKHFLDSCRWRRFERDEEIIKYLDKFWGNGYVLYKEVSQGKFEEIKRRKRK